MHLLVKTFPGPMLIAVKAWVCYNRDIPINAHPDVIATYAHVTVPGTNSITVM